MASMGQQLGYRLVDNVERVGGDTLQIMPSSRFLLDGSGEAHMATALAI